MISAESFKPVLTMNSASSTADLIRQHLACPKCKAELRVANHRYACISCGSEGELRDGVFLAKPLSAGHYFDDMHCLMQQGNESREIQEMCYSQQSSVMTELIRPGDVVWVAPNEKHWHGAAATTAMTHIAIQESLNGKAVDWMEKVSDEQYQAKRK